MIKAIIFDFYGVIRSDEYWRLIKQDKNMVSEFSKLADEVNLGDVSWYRFVQQLAKKTTKTVQEIISALESESINLPLVEYIAKLHKNYKTALLSNAAYEFFEPQARQIGFTELFDYTAVSSKLGMIKPDPRIYEHVLDKLGVGPSEAVYIDDISRFCDGASAVGMKAIWYKDFEQMKKELEQILSSDPND